MSYQDTLPPPNSGPGLAAGTAPSTTSPIPPAMGGYAMYKNDGPAGGIHPSAPPPPPPPPPHAPPQDDHYGHQDRIKRDASPPLSPRQRALEDNAIKPVILPSVQSLLDSANNPSSGGNNNNNNTSNTSDEQDSEKKHLSSPYTSPQSVTNAQHQQRSGPSPTSAQALQQPGLNGGGFQQQQQQGSYPGYYYPDYNGQVPLGQQQPQQQHQQLYYQQQPQQQPPQQQSQQMMYQPHMYSQSYSAYPYGMMPGQMPPPTPPPNGFNSYPRQASNPMLDPSNGGNGANMYAPPTQVHPPPIPSSVAGQQMQMPQQQQPPPLQQAPMPSQPPQQPQQPMPQQHPKGIKPKRKRATTFQVSKLNEVFEQTFFPSSEARQALAMELGMTPRTVQIWFQNKRQGYRSEHNRALPRDLNARRDSKKAASMVGGSPDDSGESSAHGPSDEHHHPKP